MRPSNRSARIGSTAASWRRQLSVARTFRACSFYPVQFTPASSNFSGKTIQGVHFTVTNRDIFSSSRLGLELAAALAQLYPGKIAVGVEPEPDRQQRRHARSRHRRQMPSPAADAGIQEFLELRQKYLLYH